MDLPPTNSYEVIFERVIDGDTFKGSIKIWNNLTLRQSIRIKGINAPEIRGDCDLEIREALAAKASLNSLLSTAGKITITAIEEDKFGGRIDAQVLIPGVVAPITDVGAAMLRTGLVVEYGNMKDWCK